MTQFPLTDRQKEILRSLVSGLKQNTIATEWILFYDRGNIQSIRGIDQTLWDTVWDGVKPSDFDKFVKCGFFRVSGANQQGIPVRYVLDDYAIIQAVESEFEQPKPDANSVSQPTYHFGNISGSNVNVGSTLNHVTQTLNNASSIPEDLKTELQTEITKLQTTLQSVSQEHQKDVERISRQIERLIDDLNQEQPDKESALITAEGLQKAARNIILVLPAIADITQRIFDIVTHIKL